MRKALSLQMLGGVLFFLALTLVMYQSTLKFLLHRWSLEDFNYGYFIPLVVAYLIWEKREDLVREPVVRSWAGLAPVLLALIFFWLGEFAAEFTIMYLSLWLLTVGVVWSVFGWRRLRVIAFPVIVLLTAFPPPDVIYSGLTLRLKLLSSQLGVKLLQMYGLTAYREGNVIDVGFTKLQVVDACSGLRYFFPLIILGILLAYFFKGPWWKKGVLIAAAVPVSIVTNSLRIASVGILYQYMGPAAAEGFFHDFSGWLIFMVSLGILLLVSAILKKILPEHESTADGDIASAVTMPAHHQEPAAVSGLLRFVSPQFLVIALLMVASVAAAQGVANRDRTPLKRPFSDFPDTVGGWSAKRQKLEKMYLDMLELNDYYLADFSNSRGELINCYVAYHDIQTKGKANHSPATCLPGSGWELRAPVTITVADGSGRSFTINRAMMVMGNERRLTYYWFDQRGRILTNLYQIKFYNVVDSVGKNRTDGSLIRLITPMAESETPDAADERLKGFFREFNPVLYRFLPNSTVS